MPYKIKALSPLPVIQVQRWCRDCILSTKEAETARPNNNTGNSGIHPSSYSSILWAGQANTSHTVNSVISKHLQKCSMFICGVSLQCSARRNQQDSVSPSLCLPGSLQTTCWHSLFKGKANLEIRIWLCVDSAHMRVFMEANAGVTTPALLSSFFQVPQIVL